MISKTEKMGIKLRNLNKIPRCFHLLGSNHISCLHLHRPAERLPPPPPPPLGTVKLMKPGGVVKIYDRPIHVAELMSEFPKHMVCRSDSFYIGQKIPSLPMDDQLQLGHSYFLLPAQFFQSDLSFVSIASMAKASLSSKESINALLKKAATCQPFEIEKNWSSGCLRIRVCDEFISEFIQENSKIDERWKSKVCSTPLLQKQYGQLVGSRLRHWKPKLETIKEICEMNKKKKKKSQFKNNSNVHLICAKPKALPNSKPKILTVNHHHENDPNQTFVARDYDVVVKGISVSSFSCL